MWRGGGEQRQPVLLSFPTPLRPGLPRCPAPISPPWAGGGRGCLTSPHPGALSAISGSPAAGGRGVGFAPRGGRSAFVRWPRQDGCAIMAAGVSQRLGAASGSAAPPGTEAR